MKRMPEPALVRALLVTITAVIAYFVGHAIDVSWIESVVTIYALVSSMVAAAFIRPAVTPVSKLSAGTASESE